MKKAQRDIVLGVVLLLVAGAYFYHSFGIRVFRDLAAFSVNSRTVPQIYGIILAGLSLVLIIQAALNFRAERAAAPEAAAPAQTGPVADGSFLGKYSSVLLTFFFMAVYAGTMAPLGFRVSSAIYVFFQTLVLTPKGRITGKVVGLAAVVAVVASVLVEYVFVNHLSLILP